jgi:hypothetical protein
MNVQKRSNVNRLILYRLSILWILTHDCHVKMSSEKFESLEDDLDSVLDNLKDRVESKIVHFEGG